MITITDPRLKEEIYDSLNPNRVTLKRNASNSHKLYFLGRCADFSLQDNLKDSMIV